MEKFLGSKIFVFISTLFTFVIGGIAGWLLGYQPKVSGSVSGGFTSTTGQTTTKYVFEIKTACGYWLLALLVTLIVLFLCIIVRKLYMNHQTKAETEK